MKYLQKNCFIHGFGVRVKITKKEERRKQLPERMEGDVRNRRSLSHCPRAARRLPSDLPVCDRSVEDVVDDALKDLLDESLFNIAHVQLVVEVFIE